MSPTGQTGRWRQLVLHVSVCLSALPFVRPFVRPSLNMRARYFENEWRRKAWKNQLPSGQLRKRSAPKTPFWSSGEIAQFWRTIRRISTKPGRQTLKLKGPMCHNLVQVTTTRMLKVRGQAYTRLKIKTYTVQCALLWSDPYVNTTFWLWLVTKNSFGSRQGLG